MKSKKLIITIALVIPLLFGACTACPTYYKDGGTVEYNYIVLKVIKWDTLEGKNYTEAYVFPMSLLPVVDFLHDREEKDFEKLLSSAYPAILNEPYGLKLLFNSDFDSKSEKLYKKIVSRGKRNNYFLLGAMLGDEPTAFCLPNTVCPLTSGDIAFLLLTDINCHDDWEKRLFPTELTERADFSAALMFDYLHESRENRILVARSLMEHYIDANENLKRYFEHLAGKEE